MKLVVIFGPPAVGKMTVGFELAKLTGLKLFHNHLTIELVLNFFDFTTPQFNILVGEFRRRIFEEVAKSDLKGMIFTFVWAIDLEKEREYIESFCDIFRKQNADIYFVELEADFEERLRRNESEFRLAAKTFKTKYRNVESESHSSRRKLSTKHGRRFFLHGKLFENQQHEFIGGRNRPKNR